MKETLAAFVLLFLSIGMAYGCQKENSRTEVLRKDKEQDLTNRCKEACPLGIAALKIKYSELDCQRVN